MPSIWKAEFPLYQLNETSLLTREGGLLFYEDADEQRWVIDNKDVSGKTLGARRVTLALRGYKLYKLKYVITSYQELLVSGTSHFIDSKGDVYNYTKTKTVPLITHKIKSVVPYTEGHIITLEGIHCKFISQAAPNPHFEFAQVLHVDRGFILYGFCGEKLKDTRRKI